MGEGEGEVMDGRAVEGLVFGKTRRGLVMRWRGWL